ncbi:MAG: MOSC domain-containing protein [Candidatus Baltobacteraceae bacterium]
MPLLGHIGNIWRYPIKSLRAQPLESAQVLSDGIAGDRAGALYVTGGHARLGKTYRGKENNRLHTTDRVDAARAFAGGIGLEYRADAGERYFDAAPVSLLFDTWLAQGSALVGYALDPLRFRPNIFALACEEGVPLESPLIGSEMQIGEVRLRVREGIGRCVTTTYDIQTGESDENVLFAVARNRANLMGVYCDVVRTGEIFRGDPIARL